MSLIYPERYTTSIPPSPFSMINSIYVYVYILTSLITPKQIFLITGSTTGIGYQLATILYTSNATVYICGRTEEKVQSAIKAIEAAYAASDPQHRKGGQGHGHCQGQGQAKDQGNFQGRGRLEPLALNLSDLVSVKNAAQQFLRREERLDVLVHNAGVMMPPLGGRSAQVCSIRRFFHKV
jgi:retinol dehydrogenase-12